MNMCSCLYILWRGFLTRASYLEVQAEHLVTRQNSILKLQLSNVWYSHTGVLHWNDFCSERTSILRRLLVAWFVRGSDWFVFWLCCPSEEVRSFSALGSVIPRDCKTWNDRKFVWYSGLITMLQWLNILRLLTPMLLTSIAGREAGEACKYSRAIFFTWLCSCSNSWYTLGNCCLDG